MLIQAAINGARTRAEHRAIPVTPEQQAAEARAAVAAGAGAVHVHVRAGGHAESLAPEHVAHTVLALRATCPAIPIGVSTGAWIVPDLRMRLAQIATWNVLPDFASVNLHEEGALEVVRLLLDKGVGVEAGIWTAEAAVKLVTSGLTTGCLRLLLEPSEAGADPWTTLVAIESVLARQNCPRLLHGAGASTWPLLALAARRGYDSRVGFEDALTLPDGTPAASNGDLVAAAVQLVGREAAKIRLSGEQET